MLKFAICWMVLGLATFAQGPDVTFGKALKAYDAKEYDAAIKLYEDILSGGDSAPEVHYNLGHAFFRSGDAGKAVLHYRRAQRLMPNNPELTANLRMAVESSKSPMPPPEPALELVRGVPHAVWMWIVFASFWVMMFLFCIFCFRRPGAGWWWRIGLLGLLGMAVGSVGGHFTDPQNYPDEVVVTGSSVEAMMSPDPGADVAFELEPGALAVAIGKQDDLVEVRLGKQRGWIASDSVEHVTLPAKPGTSLAVMIRSILGKG